MSSRTEAMMMAEKALSDALDGFLVIVRNHKREVDRLKIRQREEQASLEAIQLRVLDSYARSCCDDPLRYWCDLRIEELNGDESKANGRAIEIGEPRSEELEEKQTIKKAVGRSKKSESPRIEALKYTA